MFLSFVIFLFILERSSFEQEMVETARKNNHIVTNGGHVIYKKSIFDLLHEKFIDDWVIIHYFYVIHMLKIHKIEQV